MYPQEYIRFSQALENTVREKRSLRKTIDAFLTDTDDERTRAAFVVTELQTRAQYTKRQEYKDKLKEQINRLATQYQLTEKSTHQRYTYGA